MKKTLEMALVVSVFQLFAVFFPTVIPVPLQFTTGFVQTYAEEKTNTDINSLKEKLEEEEESLVGLDDELEFIAEQEEESQETINYLKTLIKEMERDLQRGNEPKEDLQEELSSVKEELNAEIVIQGEIKDEIGAFKELKKETEDRIAELNTQIQRAGSTTVAGRTETPQRTAADTSESSAVSTGEAKSAKEQLQEQIRLAQRDLEEEVEELDETEEEIEMLQEEMQEVIELREETEAVIIELLAQIKELESAVASIEAKEKIHPSAETESTDSKE
ncbi:MAG: hypothetical protein ACUZ77_09105 [Candidatus Brocadiales bacterium]